VVETVRDPDFLHAVREPASRQSITSRAASIVPGRTFDVTAAPLPGGGAVVVLRDQTGNGPREKTRRDFIATYPTNCRTPLTSIQGYTETRWTALESTTLPASFGVIRKNATRMARLTEDLLTLARVNPASSASIFSPVAPGTLLHEAVQSFRAIARTKEWICNWRISPTRG